MKKHGQMVIEVIIAVSIFVIIAASSVVAIVGSLHTARLSEEETLASLMATEGLEAVKSLRNQSWTNLTNGNHGVASISGVWTFSGSSDVDVSGKFTRVITISDVQRDINKNIVASGGTVDAETKKVVSTVSWNFTPLRANSVILTMYLTRWQLGKSSSTMPQFCSDYCITLFYTSGVCRSGKPQCLANNEVPENGGNKLCTGPGGGVCCCQL